MTIFVQNLEIVCIIGILESERTTPQRLIVDLRIDYDPTKGFLDYTKVTRLIEERLTQGKFGLLETAAEELASLLHAHFEAILALNLRLTKPDILPNCQVGIELDKKFL